MFNLSFPFKMELIVMEGSVLSLCSAKRCFKFWIVDTFRVSSNAYIPIFSYNFQYLNPTSIFSYISPQTPINCYKWEVEKLQKILRTEFRAAKELYDDKGYNDTNDNYNSNEQWW